MEGAIYGAESRVKGLHKEWGSKDPGSHESERPLLCLSWKWQGRDWCFHSLGELEPWDWKAWQELWLNSSSSKLHVYKNHLGVLLKDRFWFHHSVVSPRFCSFNKSQMVLKLHVLSMSCAIRSTKILLWLFWDNKTQVSLIFFLFTSIFHCFYIQHILEF